MLIKNTTRKAGFTTKRPTSEVNMRHTLITAVCAIAAVAVTYSLLLGYVVERGGMEVPGGIILFINDLP